MSRTRSLRCVPLFVLALCATSLSGQDLPTDSGRTGFDPNSVHAHKLAGFAAGATVGAVVMSLDAVLGSSCIGSGDYLVLCRAGLVGGALLAGGVGALVGRAIRTEEAYRRRTWTLVGSALGASGAFVASVAVCSQEDESNPDFLCRFDGMIEPAPLLVSALLGGALGRVISGPDQGAQRIHAAVMPGPGGGLGLSARVFW